MICEFCKKDIAESQLRPMPAHNVKTQKSVTLFVVICPSCVKGYDCADKMIGEIKIIS